MKMKTRLLIPGILVAVFGVLGFMLYVDMNYCYQNIFPSDDLLFAICSDVFGVEGLLVTIVNSIYSAIQGN